MTCDYDTDCLGADLCVEHLCLAVCAGDTDCLLMEHCQAYLRPGEGDPVHVCMPDDETPNNEGAQCEADADCRALLDDADAICGIERRCVVPVAGSNNGTTPLNNDRAEALHAVLIRDRSVAPEGDVEFSGAEIAAVFVRDAGGAIVGWGRTLEYTPAVVPDATSHLDGSALPLVASGQCTDAHAAGPTALGGEGGYLLLDFADETGVALMLEEGWTLVVIERSENCDAPSTPDDEYEVALCVSTSAAGLDPERDCAHTLGAELSGYAEFTLSSPQSFL